jgi:hypothetical protein
MNWSEILLTVLVPFFAAWWAGIQVAISSALADNQVTKDELREIWRAMLNWKSIVTLSAIRSLIEFIISRVYPKAGRKPAYARYLPKYP